MAGQNFNCFIYLIIILICSFLISFHLLSNSNNNYIHIPSSSSSTSSSSTSSASSASLDSSSSTITTTSNIITNKITNSLKNITQITPLINHFKFSSNNNNNNNNNHNNNIQRKVYDFDTSFLTCENQSKCIEPHLQLAILMKIYLCKHTSQGGVRFFYLVRDGLLLHPKVIWMENLNYDEVDYLIYLPNSSPWPKSECGNPNYANKLIVLDEFDGSLNFAPYASKEERLKYYPIDPHTKAPIWNYMFLNEVMYVVKMVYLLVIHILLKKMYFQWFIVLHQVIFNQNLINKEIVKLLVH